MPESTNVPNPSPEGQNAETGERPPRQERHDRGGSREPRYGGDRGDRGDRGGREPRYGGSDRDDRGGRRPRRFHRGKVCQFCVDKSIYIDYKDLERLRNFVTDTGKILPRRITGNCASHQRMTTNALKRARMVALLPYKAK